jgi:DNA-binding CsgD family transcriptional regulator
LVPCDVVTYHEAVDNGRKGFMVFHGEPIGEMTTQVREAHRRYTHQDPLKPGEGARKVTDFLSLREYRRLGLYQKVDRPLGIEYMMRLSLDSGGPRGARLEFDRALSDFDERDRAVLDLLLPHLKQFRRRAVARRLPARPAHVAAGLTRREREVLEHVAAGRTNGEVAWLLGISPETVRKHLENSYEKLGVHTRTGAVAAVFKHSR